MFGALKQGFRSLATLKLVVNVVGELLTEKNSCGIARFPCENTAQVTVKATKRDGTKASPPIIVANLRPWFKLHVTEI